MKNSAKLIITVLIGFTIFSCSSDDDSNQVVPEEETVISFEEVVDVEIPIVVQPVKITLPEDVTNEAAITIIKEGIEKGMTNLYVSNTTNLTNLDLTLLSTIDTLEIMNNVGLNTIKLPNLEMVNELTVRSNDLLSTVDLPNVTEAGTLSFNSNSLLESIILPSLVTVNNDFAVFGSDNLTEITFNELTQVKGLISITNCLSIASISTPNLTEVDEMRISTNENLINIELDKLAIFNERLSISSNENLETVSLPKLTESKVSMSIGGNPNLTSINLPVLTSVATTRATGNNEDDGGLYITNNGILETIYIPNLEFTNVLYLGNDSVKSISIPKLTNASYFVINSNIEIETLDLSALKDFDYLDFTSNGNLSTPVIDELLNTLVNIIPAITEKYVDINGTASTQGLIDAETLRTKNNTVNIRL